MNLVACYHLLELPSGASTEDIKASYRRLARRYHPDVNPDKARAQEQFMAITEAYKALLKVTPAAHQSPTPAPTRVQETRVRSQPRPSKPPAPPRQPPIHEYRLRRQSYHQLQRLFQEQRFPRAIALVEGLAQRFPQDREIAQWQALTYHRWGRHLIHQGHFDKARTFLKKALHADPHNRSLWAEVERDFRHIEQSLS